MKKPILILGAGGFAREVYHWIPKDKYQVIGFYQDVKSKETHLLGLPIFHSLNDLEGIHFVVAVGDPNTRVKLNAKAVTLYRMVMCEPIIHPTAVIADTSKISDGAIICPFSVISDSVKIGFSVIVNLASTIGHDAELDNFATVSPGANISGNVKIGMKAYIGTNAAIREGVTVGDFAVVGMGSVVVKDVSKSTTVMGNPAKIKV